MLTLPRAFLLALHKSGSSSLSGNGAQGSLELGHIFFSPVLLLFVFLRLRHQAELWDTAECQWEMGSTCSSSTYQKCFCFAISSNYLFQLYQLHSWWVKEMRNLHIPLRLSKLALIKIYLCCKTRLALNLLLLQLSKKQPRSVQAQLPKESTLHI